MRRFLVNVCADPDGARLVIDGVTGVGKTSFLNYNQYILYKQLQPDPALTFRRPRLIPSLRKIQIREREDFDGVLLKILSGCVFSLQAVCRENKVPFPPRLSNI